jgi:hypothetical protein
MLFPFAMLSSSFFLTFYEDCRVERVDVTVSASVRQSKSHVKRQAK